MHVRDLDQFRRLTADLPGNTRLLVNVRNVRGYHYKDAGACVVTAIETSPNFEPDIGDDTFFLPDLSEEEVRGNRQTVVVIS